MYVEAVARKEGFPDLISRTALEDEEERKCEIKYSIDPKDEMDGPEYHTLLGGTEYVQELQKNREFCNE
jgi:hypothetical protein